MDSTGFPLLHWSVHWHESTKPFAGTLTLSLLWAWVMTAHLWWGWSRATAAPCHNLLCNVPTSLVRVSYSDLRKRRVEDFNLHLRDNTWEKLLDFFPTTNEGEKVRDKDKECFRVIGVAQRGRTARNAQLPWCNIVSCQPFLHPPSRSALLAASNSMLQSYISHILNVEAHQMQPLADTKIHSLHNWAWIGLLVTTQTVWKSMKQGIKCKAM